MQTEPIARASEICLSDELAALRGDFDRLSELVSALASEPPPQSLAPGEISAEEARARVISFFETHERPYPTEIAKALNLDYETVLEALCDLERYGAASPVSAG